ncbi:MAG: energy transducer TonB [Thiobacillus sp.]|uniref:energy transducer TonB family protein n=1 Tax=Thiobacillus sp. TaxID=924 RepID=UPI002893CB6A|nr:energy transducer TonB [Thiobacillus sp.]MDT3707899.1 energy transducer TonB [Thiobacillus sp.]
MPDARTSFLVALALSLGVHAGLLALGRFPALPPPLSAVQEPLRVDFTLAPVPPAKPARPAMPMPPSVETQQPVRVPDAPTPPVPEKTPATMAAPPAPTAEEWALAATYTLKNSKRYRYNWGQQVRSMMGTAVEGERQGLVRFRIEIAPDGTLARADVLWSTSELVVELALQAIRAMPSLPPTPTGKPLVFEKTIAFLPFETGWPPIYKYDCLPDPPSFKSPFAWNGVSPRPVTQARESASPADGAGSEAECSDAEPDSIEAEEKDMERQFKEWGSLGE